MEQMKGWRTLVGNAVILLICVVVVIFVADPQLKAAAVSAGVMALGNFGFRHITDSPVGYLKK